MLLSTKLLILSTLLLVSQNIAHFIIRLLSSLVGSLLPLLMSCEPIRKSILLLFKSLYDYFFFLKALDI